MPIYLVFLVIKSIAGLVILLASYNRTNILNICANLCVTHA